jgi:hypothetical protein
MAQNLPVPALKAPLPTSLAHVIALATDPQVYEKDAIAAIPPNSKKRQILQHLRETLVPQFFLFQQEAEGPAANTVEFYQAQMPNDPFGCLLASFVHYVFFQR